MCVSPDGTRIASGSLDKTVRVWAVDGAREVCRLNGHEDGVQCVRFSPDGKRLASCGKDKSLRVWDCES